MIKQNGFYNLSLSCFFYDNFSIFFTENHIFNLCGKIPFLLFLLAYLHKKNKAYSYWEQAFKHSILWLD